jgi:hypothetical protein
MSWIYLVARTTRTHRAIRLSGDLCNRPIETACKRRGTCGMSRRTIMTFNLGLQQNKWVK